MEGREEFVTKKSREGKGGRGRDEQTPGTAEGGSFSQWGVSFAPFTCLNMFRPCERIHRVVGNVGGCIGVQGYMIRGGVRGSRARLSQEL